MSGTQTFFLFLVVCVGNSQSWFWITNSEETTAAPTVVPTAAPTAAPTAVPTAAPTANISNVTVANATREEEDDELSGVGEDILALATGLQKFFEVLTPIIRNTAGAPWRAEPNSTGNATASGGEGEREGSGSGPAAIGSGGELRILDAVRLSDRTNASGGGRNDAPPPPCLPVPSDWPVCSGVRALSLPNALNHTSVEQVGAVLKEWAWLARRTCHPAVERFLCLLLAPGCPAPGPAPGPALPPCRSFCQTLRDSCWASLDLGRLPVDCHLLPDVAPERHPPACVNAGTWRGNGGSDASPWRYILNLTTCVCCVWRGVYLYQVGGSIQPPPVQTV